MSAPRAPFRSAISAAWADFDRKLSATTSLETANTGVRITGVSFWDDNHGQRGVAPNAIELHPVLGVTFDPAAGTGTCQPTLPAGTVKAAVSSAGGGGYLMAAEAGGVAVFGDQPCAGSMARRPLSAPIVGAAATPSGAGYWLVGADGGVFSFGDARFFGSTGNLRLNQPVVGMSGAPDGAGYRFVATDGGIFSYGSTAFYGATGAMRLNQPIVGMATAPSGAGYWLVARDGGIFSFGDDAAFHGAAGATKLNQPIVGMAPTPTGAGYWLVASDGGIFSFGDASFFGSTGAIKLNRPITAMAATPTGAGYWLFASDGGVFSYGDAGYFGSAVAPTPPPTSPPPGSGQPLAFGAMQCDAPGTPDDAHNINDEWVELVNTGGSAAPLLGSKIHDEGAIHTYTFPSFTLGPGAKVKLHTGSGADTATDLYWGQGSHVWNNTGTENAYLLNADGAEITKKSCR